VFVEHVDGPKYADDNKSVVYELVSSDYDKETVLVGEEAVDLLGKYNLLLSLPQEANIGGVFGTEEKPFYIPSLNKYRIVSCQGKYEESHPVLYMRLIKGQKSECPQCGQVMQLISPEFKVHVKPGKTLGDEAAENVKSFLESNPELKHSLESKLSEHKLE
jgi:hypothetical protein